MRICAFCDIVRRWRPFEPLRGGSMTKAKRSLCAVSLVLATMVVAVGPANASRFGISGFPQYPSFPFEDRAGSGGPANFVQDAKDPNLWVWTIDPMVYGAN